MKQPLAFLAAVASGLAAVWLVMLLAYLPIAFVTFSVVVTLRLMGVL